MEYVRISEILSRLQDFRHIDPEVLQNKCNIGTDVHSAIEAHANFDFAAGKDLECRRLAYFDSYHLWYQKVKPVYKITERRFYDNELMITGQLDAVAVIDNQLCLIDFKTGANESMTRDGTSAWRLQAHFYRHLLFNNGIMVGPEMRWVQLRTKRIKDPYFGSDMVIGAIPKVFTYQFDPEVMSRCYDEVHKYWEERAGAISVD